MQDNFTRLNFGWLGYWLPGEETVGTQPDQLEFVTSKAAAWDCPISIQADPARLAPHPRTADNFEVFRRWEEVRARKWLNDEQKQMLRDPEQEFTLLLDEENDLELVPYDRVASVAGGSRDVIAFTFERKEAFYAVYWHISGDRELGLPMKPEDLVVLESLGKEVGAGAGERENTSVVPLGKRRYLKTSKSRKDELIAALGDAQIV